MGEGVGSGAVGHGKDADDYADQNQPPASPDNQCASGDGGQQKSDVSGGLHRPGGNVSLGDPPAEALATLLVETVFKIEIFIGKVGSNLGEQCEEEAAESRKQIESSGKNRTGGSRNDSGQTHGQRPRPHRLNPSLYQFPFHKL